MNEIKVRISTLRKIMKEKKLDAVYISGTDPHASEYLPDYWKTRAFVSGFTGSFGIVVITQKKALLWTDTRYFIQAEEQLKDTGFEMKKLRIPEAVLPEKWLLENLKFGARIGTNFETISIAELKRFSALFAEKNINIFNSGDLFEKLWKKRPDLTANPIFELENKYAGASRKKKQENVAAELDFYGADYFVITMLDELAWLFNLRGSDVSYNPVFLGFGITGKNESKLFVQKGSLNKALKNKLQTEGIEILDYNQFYDHLNALKNKKIILDPASSNYKVYSSLSENNECIEKISPVSMQKSIKNKMEEKGFHEAMIKDGVALVEFLHWLEQNLGKQKITEYTAGQKLNEFRKKQNGYFGESFPPIVGYKSHGAIVHLTVDAKNALEILPEGILLFDSGGHYLQGTTDVTRTVALGKVSEQQKTDFTLVLKGMIALSKAKFPYGTKGCHIDILARKPLWENGMNYGHGTGHGVGHFLNVHEGPASIRQECTDVSIKPGMVFSNEPAFYRENEYGLRIENMIVCVEKETTDSGHFLGFDTLTLCPIDTSLIQKNRLVEDEINWLNNYHQLVYKKLSPFLSYELQSFLHKKTLPH